MKFLSNLQYLKTKESTKDSKTYYQCTMLGEDETLECNCSESVFSELSKLDRLQNVQAELEYNARMTWRPFTIVGFKKVS